MRVDSRLGTYEDIRALVPANAATLDVIRASVQSLDRDGVETASPGDRSVWWSVTGARTKDGHSYATTHAGHVNLGFFQGASLPDPERLLEGTGKALRHIKLRDPREAQRPAVMALLRAAIAERRDALNPK